MFESMSPKQIQENLRSSARQVWLAGIGAMSSFEEESGRVIDQLVARGREFESRRQQEVGKKVEGAKAEVKSTVDRISTRLDQQVAARLEQLGVPTTAQVRELRQRVERLTALIESLETTQKRQVAQAQAQETSTIYHVTPHEEGWKVQAEGAERASRVTETKAEAVEIGRELAQNHQPSQLVVHRLDGTIQNHYTYGEEEAAA